MAVVGFISHRYMDNYDFEKIFENGDRYFAIILESCLNLFPKDKKKFFSKIYTIPDKLCSDGPLVKFEYEEIKKIVMKEMKLNFKEEPFSLICIDEINISLIGRLRDELGIPGPSESLTSRFQDKLIMKKALENTSVRIPKYENFSKEKIENSALAYYDYLKNVFGLPFVLKPRAYAGSFGVFIVNNVDDFMGFLSKKIYYALEYEVEEFIDGNLYHTDIVLKDGKVIFIETCQYTYPNHLFSKGKIIASLVLQESEDLKKKLDAHAILAVETLGKMNGTYHVEQFVNGNGNIFFLEAAARPAGIFIAYMYEEMYGINLFTLDLASKLGRDISFHRIPNLHCLQASVPYQHPFLEKINQQNFKSKISRLWISNSIKSDQKSNFIVDIAAKFLLSSHQYADINFDFHFML